MEQILRSLQGKGGAVVYINPVFLAFAVGYLLGIIWGECVVIPGHLALISDTTVLLCLGIGAILCIVFWMLCRRHVRGLGKKWVVLTVLVLMGFGWGVAGMVGITRRSIEQKAVVLGAIDRDSLVRFRGVVASHPVIDRSGTHFEFTLSHILTDATVTAIHAKAWVRYHAPIYDLSKGEVVICHLAVERLNHASHLQRFLRYRNIDFAATLVKREMATVHLPGSLEAWVSMLRARLQALFNTADPSGVGIALVLGDRRNLNRHLNQFLVRTQTMHLFVISGLHVGLLFWLCLTTLQGVLARLPGIRMMYDSENLAILLSIGVLGVYLTVIDFPICATRAYLASAIWGVIRIAGRQTSLFNILFLIGFFSLLIAPYLLFDLSFQLSYGCMVVISVILPVVDSSRGIAWFRYRIANRIISSGITNTWILIFLVPFQVHYFQGISFWAPIFNVILIPFVGCVLVPTTIFVGILAIVGPLDLMTRTIHFWGVGLDRFCTAVLDQLPFELHYLDRDFVWGLYVIAGIFYLLRRPIWNMMPQGTAEMVVKKCGILNPLFK